MSRTPQQKASELLSIPERLIAATIGVALLSVAVVILVWPPKHEVALAQCKDASAGCIVSVDSDLSTFAAALAALGGLVALVGILGIRFNRFKLPGGELSREGYKDATAGLPEVPPTAKHQADLPARPVPSPAVGEAPGESPEATEAAPIVVEIEEGLGHDLKAPTPVPIAVTRLTRPMREVDPAFLRDYREARKES